jgi:hypothetical protein
MASAMPITAGPKPHTSLPQAGVKAEPQRLNWRVAQVCDRTKVGAPHLAFEMWVAG